MTDLSDIKYNGWSNWETWLVVSHILDDDPALTEQFVEEACGSYDHFVDNVQSLAYDTWDVVAAWFHVLDKDLVNWAEIANSIRYVPNPAH